MASGGYPTDYETGFEVTGLDEASAMEGVAVFHAGTILSDGKILTAGGRVL
ncbi:MAG TPA: phosphoribosylamine--glycine ligase, partial [Actinobacteria bacterium]|nr:phosphoribosylamine--glycine ligase [Actinomycetota bacterium]